MTHPFMSYSRGDDLLVDDENADKFIINFKINTPTNNSHIYDAILCASSEFKQKYFRTSF